MMNKVGQTQKDKTFGHLLLLPSSDRWPSAIVRAAAQEQVAVKLFACVESLANAIDAFRPAVVVLDFSDLSTNSLAQFFDATRLPLFKTPLFAVGSGELCDIRLDLVQAGFSEVFSSTGQTSRLIGLAKSYFETAPAVAYSIEEVVARDLPWVT